MEFFEKAHIMKSDESKSKKSTENVKKQLKQMLYGYKVSDNKLIQNAGNIEKDFDDSTSVSGFSDLNLTNSSHEDDTTHAETTANDESSLDLSENLSTANVLSDNNHTPNHEDEFHENSISENNENIESFSEVIIDEEDVSSLNDSNISIISGILESSPESESSDVFDADGNLAAEILKKLELRNVKKLKHKRKYSEVDNDDYMILYKNQMKEEVFSETETSDRDNVLSSSSDEIDTKNYFGANPKSPQFVSITATDMQNQSLDEILGEYKYSTIRNITSENFNTASSTNNSGIFTEDSMNVEIQTEDDVCSLIPEVDDIQPAEEIDKELENLEMSHTQTEESINNLDNTLLSEMASDTELVMTEDSVNLEETFKLYYTRNSCIVTLKHPSELFIQGKVKIKALFGKVEVFGYTLKDEICNVYAPYYNFAQFIKTVENSSAYYGLFGKLTSSGLTATEAEDIVTSIGHQDGVIVLQSLDEVTMDFVDSNFKATNLFVKPNKMIEPFFIKASDILNCSLFSARPWKSFEIHPVWKEANGHAQNELSRGIVCGGAGVGKSTYLRYQVNKLLDNGPVLVVDLDPGQCEFTVAGNISATIVTSPLFGPSFTHLKKPEIMLNIGMINTMDNAKRYVSAVHSLITHCSNNETLANMRWIINTMGMTNVLGHKFITLIITLSKPTYLIQYESKSNKKRFESFLRPHNVRLMYEDYRNDYLFANTSCPNDLNYSFVLANDTERSFKGKFSLRPKDERYLNFMAYFSQLINIQKNILGIVPYQVHLKELYIGTNVIIKEDCVTKVINGKIVALCQQAQQCVTASPKVFTLSDKPLRCYGHGLIRGVDWEKEILYVITPVPSKELGSVDTLVYADWVPELVGQEIQLPKGTVVPYRTITQDHNKQLMSTPRRRFNPLQLLKMARSS